MRVEIWQGSTYLAKTHTAWNGTYSVTFALPGTSCVGQAVTVQHWMERIHESDLNVWPPRYRYSIVVFESGKSENQMLTIWKLNAAVTLTGSSTSVAVTVAADASLASRVANMYFIANSAMTQVATWSTRISDHFASTSGAADGIFRIVYGPDNPGAGGGTNVWDWNVVLGYDTYNRGMILRHEIGHEIREAVHDRVCQLMGCSTYFYNYVDGYDAESCEYGSAALNEGIASFFGMRSAVSEVANAWDCTCANNGQQDVCSVTSNGALPTEGFTGCTGGSFAAIGDRWITSQAQCKRVKESKGCSGCAQDANGYCVASSIYGWRNPLQAERFLWDLIDSDTDNGYDLVDYSIAGLVSAMQGMPTGYGVDGSCRESERASVADCNPVVNGAPVTGGTGSRDAYNVQDIAALLPDNTAWVKTINCASFATDN